MNMDQMIEKVLKEKMVFVAGDNNEDYLTVNDDGSVCVTNGRFEGTNFEALGATDYEGWQAEDMIAAALSKMERYPDLIHLLTAEEYAQMQEEKRIECEKHMEEILTPKLLAAYRAWKAKQAIQA